MRIVERVLERRIRELLNIDSIQFGFMPGRGTTVALFAMRRMEDEYKGKKKSCTYVLWILRRHLIEFQEK